MRLHGSLQGFVSVLGFERGVHQCLALVGPRHDASEHESLELPSIVLANRILQHSTADKSLAPPARFFVVLRHGHHQCGGGTTLGGSFLRLPMDRISTLRAAATLPGTFIGTRHFGAIWTFLPSPLNREMVLETCGAGAGGHVFEIGRSTCERAGQLPRQELLDPSFFQLA